MGRRTVSWEIEFPMLCKVRYVLTFSFLVHSSCLLVSSEAPRVLWWGYKWIIMTIQYNVHPCIDAHISRWSLLLRRIQQDHAQYICGCTQVIRVRAWKMAGIPGVCRQACWHLSCGIFVAEQLLKLLFCRQQGRFGWDLSQDISDIHTSVVFFGPSGKEWFLYGKEWKRLIHEYGIVWCGVVWYGMVWCGVVWCGMVWYGVVWNGMVWYGMVWYGMVWYCMSKFS